MDRVDTMATMWMVRGPDDSCRGRGVNATAQVRIPFLQLHQVRRGGRQAVDDQSSYGGYVDQLPEYAISADEHIRLVHGRGPGGK